MKRLLLQIVCLLFSVISYGQVNILADTDKKTVGEKERFTLFVIQEINGNELIQETPLRTPDLSKFNVVGQGSVRQTYGDPETHTVINQLIYEFLLEPKAPGKHKIGSFLVTVNGKIYMTDPFEVTVKEGEAQAKNSREEKSDQVRLDLNIKNKELYPNEPTLAIVRAYSRDFNQLRRVGKVRFPHEGRVTYRPVSYNRENIVQESSGLSSQILALAIVIAQEPGRVIAPAVSAILKEDGARTREIRSNSVRMMIRALPEPRPVTFSGAVGQYRISLEPNVTEGPLEVGKPIEVELKLTGKGNLDSALLPRLKETEHYSIFKPEVETKITPGSAGMEGEVKAKYLIVPKKPGSFDLQSETFAYLDPHSGNYEQLQSRSLKLTALSSDEIESAKTTLEKVNEYTNNVLETVNTPIIETSAYKVKEDNTLSWKPLLSNYILIAVTLALGLLFYTFLRRVNRQQPKTLSKDLGSVKETEEILREQLLVGPSEFLQSAKSSAEAGDKNGFFENIEELDKAVDQRITRKEGKGLKAYLSETFGESFLEEYRSFREKIRIEKFAPTESRDSLMDLYSDAERIYTKFL